MVTFCIVERSIVIQENFGTIKAALFLIDNSIHREITKRVLLDPKRRRGAVNH